MSTASNNSHLRSEDVGAGPALVFLHGFPFSHDVWRKQIEIFGASFRVIVPDLRGFGGSPTRPGATSMLEYLSDVYALLQERGTGPVVLVGHSMGGYVALAFARHFPDMLRGLVLISSKASVDSLDGEASRRAVASRWKEEGVHVVVRTAATKMLAFGNRDAHHAAQVDGALPGMTDRSGATPGLARIVAPTLIITGEDDAIVPPEESEKLAWGIRGSELKVIPDAGHLVAFEQPLEFNRVLREWMGRKGFGGFERPAAVLDPPRSRPVIAEFHAIN